MNEYRTRLHHVDAVQYEAGEQGRAAVLDFMGGPEFARVERTSIPGPGRGMVDGARVTTIDTTCRLNAGQWLIRHRQAQGTTYEVMRPEVFERTYEPDTADVPAKGR